MFDQTPFIEKARGEIAQLSTNFKPADLAFFIYSGYYINSQKTVIEKIVAAVTSLSNHPAFKKYLIEFYFARNEKLRLVALYGTSLKQSTKYLGQSIDYDTTIASVLGKEECIEEENPLKNDHKRIFLLKELNIKTSVYFPLNNTGILAVSKTTHGKFTQKEKLFIQNFLSINLKPSLGLAMENEANIKRAIRDQMTGFYNHTFFKLRLKEEATGIQRDSMRHLSLIMIDIDYFKNYNDKNGHPKGDVAIKKIAAILKKNTRGSDIVARYGGEEFAVLMPNTHLADASSKAERLRKAIEETTFENEKYQPNKKITISIGVATMPMHALTAESLLEHADIALYNSKEKGKNRVTIYQSDVGKGEV